MDDPVQVEAKNSRAKWSIFQFQDVRYYRKASSGYYHNGKERLNRVVWAAAHGDIPEGFVIHHKDNGRANNRLENLQLMDGGEHASLHARQPERVRQSRENFKAAVQWRKDNPERVSEIGRMGAAAAKARQNERVPFKCAVCGGVYQSNPYNRKKGYCSNRCRAQARRNSGVDDEQRDCPSCGAVFTINKYFKARTCSHVCGSAMRKDRGFQHHGR